MYDYITLADIQTYQGFTPDANQQKYSTTYLNYACARINWISGNTIETIGLDNFNDKEQEVIKRATSLYAYWLFTTGQDWAVKNLNYSTNSFSLSQAPPTSDEQRDYTLRQVYNMLNTINLFNQRIYLQDTDNFSPPNNYRTNDNFTTPWDGSSFAMSYAAGYYYFIKYDNYTSSDNSVTITPTYVNNQRYLDIKATQELMRDLSFSIVINYSFASDSNFVTVENNTTFQQFADKIPLFPGETKPTTWGELAVLLAPNTRRDNTSDMNIMLDIKAFEVGSRYLFGGRQPAQNNNNLVIPQYASTSENSTEFYYDFVTDLTSPGLRIIIYSTNQNLEKVSFGFNIPSVNLSSGIDLTDYIQYERSKIPTNIPARSGQFVLVFRRFLV